MAIRPELPAKDAQGEDRFVGFMRKLVQVPHSEIKAKLEAEKAAKRTSKRASRVSGEVSR